MAYRFSIRKHLKFGFLRPQWGVRGSLFAAFAVIAGMAIIISAGAGLVLGQLGKAMVDLSGRDIPRLAASGGATPAGPWPIGGAGIFRGPPPACNWPLKARASPARDRCCWRREAR